MKITQDNLVSTFVIMLLFIQVVSSAFIIRRLDSLENNLTNTNSALAANDPNYQAISTYVENVSVDDDPEKGNPLASVVIVEFSDYQCPACGYATTIVKSILEDYAGEIKFVYRDFPLEHTHPNAVIAAEAANCAGDQDKYWEMHDLLFPNQTSLGMDSLISYGQYLELNIEKFTTCLVEEKYKDEVYNDYEAGLAYGVNSTPTFFINGHSIVGANEAEIRNKIDEILTGE